MSGIINNTMATKAERAFSAGQKKANDYVDKNRQFLSRQYCMSNDQLTQVNRAWFNGFLAGVNFK